jgi:hypothetical protein
MRRARFWGLWRPLPVIGLSEIQVILGTIKLLSQLENSPWNLVKPFASEAGIVWRAKRISMYRESYRGLR